LRNATVGEAGAQATVDRRSSCSSRLRLTFFPARRGRLPANGASRKRGCIASSMVT